MEALDGIYLTLPSVSASKPSSTISPPYFIVSDQGTCVAYVILYDIYTTKWTRDLLRLRLKNASLEVSSRLTDFFS
jgi:hypothetical protein